MWLFFWAVIAFFVLGVFLWSLLILQQQKNAWKKFAKKHDLNYDGGSLMSPPVLNGEYGDYLVYFYTEAQETSDGRGQRYRTIVEIEMGEGMPTKAAIASPDYATFLSEVNMNQTVKIKSDDWKKSNVVKTSSKTKLEAYLTPPRVKLITRLFNLKNTNALLFFDELDCVLRFELSDPLNNFEKLEKFMKSAVSGSAILMPEPQEAAIIKNMKTESKTALDVEGVGEVDIAGLSLEGDDPEDGAAVEPEEQVKKKKPSEPKKDTEGKSKK